MCRKIITLCNMKRRIERLKQWWRSPPNEYDKVDEEYLLRMAIILPVAGLGVVLPLMAIPFLAEAIVWMINLPPVAQALMLVVSLSALIVIFGQMYWMSRKDRAA